MDKIVAVDWKELLDSLMKKRSILQLSRDLEVSPSTLYAIRRGITREPSYSLGVELISVFHEYTGRETPRITKE